MTTVVGVGVKLGSGRGVYQLVVMLAGRVSTGTGTQEVKRGLVLQHKSVVLMGRTMNIQCRTISGGDAG